MYLYKKTYIWQLDDLGLSLNWAKTPEYGGDSLTKIRPERIKYISEEVAYWRKANQIHKWFVDNAQAGNDNCEPHRVGRDQLQKLLDTVNKVLNSLELTEGEIVNGYRFKDGKQIPILQEGKIIKDPSIAQELLPSDSGFFFGSTEYDEFYCDDLKYTKEKLEEVLKEVDEDDWAEFEYQSSW